MYIPLVYTKIVCACELDLSSSHTKRPVVVVSPEARSHILLPVAAQPVSFTIRVAGTALSLQSSII